MMGRTHALLGFNALWLLDGAGSLSFALGGTAPLMDTGRFTLCALLATFGALLPDLDASASLLQSISFAGVRPFTPLGRALHRSLGHRGFLHSLPALGVLSLLALVMSLLIDGFDWWMVLSLCFGYASHLLGDACTKSGVPLFWNFRATRQRNIHLLPKPLRLTTGSMAEEAVFAALGALALLLALHHLPVQSLES